jgi:hypothetical protein
VWGGGAECTTANADHIEGPYNESEDSSSSLGMLFTRKWNVVDHLPIKNFKTIRVRIEWNHNGEPRHLDMETQIGLKNLEYFQ